MQDILLCSVDTSYEVCSSKFFQGIRSTKDNTYYCRNCVKNSIISGGKLSELRDSLNALFKQHKIGVEVKEKLLTPNFQSCLTPSQNSIAIINE